MYVCMSICFNVQITITLSSSLSLVQFGSVSLTEYSFPLLFLSLSFSSPLFLSSLPFLRSHFQFFLLLFPSLRFPLSLHTSILSITISFLLLYLALIYFFFLGLRFALFSFACVFVVCFCSFVSYFLFVVLLFPFRLKFIRCPSIFYSLQFLLPSFL